MRDKWGSTRRYTGEEQRDKEQQHLDDHHQDLLHEEALLNCEHEDFKITNIENVRTHDLRGHKMNHPMVEVELTCDFCDKTNYGDIRLVNVLELLNEQDHFHSKRNSPYHSEKSIKPHYEEWS